MHMTDLAPVLSATSSRDCIWIIVVPQLVPPASALADSLGPESGWKRCSAEAARTPQRLQRSLQLCAERGRRVKPRASAALGLRQHGVGVADLELAGPLDVQRLDDAVVDEHRVALRAHAHA